jgi:hypothetical protein
VDVVATDFSAQLLERARARSSEYSERIEYRLVDATSEEQIRAWVCSASMPPSATRLSWT